MKKYIGCYASGGNDEPKIALQGYPNQMTVENCKKQQVY